MKRPWTAVVVGSLLLAPLLVESMGDLPAFRTTTEHGPTGLSSALLLVKGLGAEHRLLRYGFHELSRLPATAVLISTPVEHPWLAPGLTSQDAEDVRRFVGRGGSVLLSSGSDDRLSEVFGLGPSELETLSETTEWVPVAPHPLVTVESLRARSSRTLDDPGAKCFPLYAHQNRVTAAECRFGSGSIVVLSDPSVIDNGGLAHDENLRWVSQWLSRVAEEGGTVVFDEVHAGGAASWGLVPWLTARGLGPALAALASWLVLWGLRTARRVGDPLGPPPLGDQRPASDHARALGDLHRRARHTGHALALLARRLRLEWAAAEARGELAIQGQRASMEGLRQAMPSLLDSETKGAAVVDAARVVQQVRTVLDRSRLERR